MEVDSDLQYQQKVASDVAEEARRSVLSEADANEFIKNMIITDPKTGEQRVADPSNPGDMALLEAQNGESVWQKVDSNNPIPMEILFGRGALKPRNVVDCGAVQELPGIFPPHPDFFGQFQHGNDASFRVDAMLAGMISFMTATPTLLVLIKGQFQPYSLSSLEIYSVYRAYFQILSRGHAIPGDDELDHMDENQGRIPYLLTKERKPLSELDEQAVDIYSANKLLMNETGDGMMATDSAKSKELREKITDNSRMLELYLFEELLHYKTGDRNIISEDLIKAGKTHRVILPSSHPLAQEAAANGTLAEEQPIKLIPDEDGNLPTPEKVAVNAVYRPTPEWFATSWHFMFGNKDQAMNEILPPILPIWVEDSYLVGVLNRAVLFFYHGQRNAQNREMLKMCNEVYEAMTSGGMAMSDEHLMNGLMRIHKFFVDHTVDILELMELCILLLIAEAVPLERHKAFQAKYRPFDQTIRMPDGRNLPVVVGVDQAALESDGKLHLPAGVKDEHTGMLMALTETFREVLADHPMVGPLINGLIGRVNVLTKGNQLPTLPEWQPSYLFLISMTLYLKIINDMFVEKVDNQWLLRLYEAAKGRIHLLLPETQRRAKLETKRQARIAEETKNKRPAEHDVEVEDEEEEEDAEMNK